MQSRGGGLVSVNHETAERILIEIREAQTPGEVDAIARRRSTAVQELSESPSLFVRAIHIKNAAAQRRRELWADIEAAAKLGGANG